MTCPAWLEAISAKVDGELGEPELAALEHHLATCPGCRHGEQEFERLRRRMRIRVVEPEFAMPAIDLERCLPERSSNRVLARRVVIACCIALLVVAGGRLATYEPEPPTTPPEIAGSDVEVVRASDDQFDRPSVTVRSGTTVEWENTGDVAHRIVRDLDTTTVASDLAPGETDDVTFTEPGTYRYFCAIHEEMQGNVEVRP